VPENTGTGLLFWFSTVRSDKLPACLASGKLAELAVTAGPAPSAFPTE
jgi:hypothetical protein